MTKIKQRNLFGKTIYPRVEIVCQGTFYSIQTYVDSTHAWGESLSAQTPQVIPWLDELFVWIENLIDAVDLPDGETILIRILIRIIKLIINLIDLKKAS
ncbi:MAG: hypothetical protein PHP43_04875 [Methanoculleus sp.]|nr:hypothetical protein [Methanoculleus sp.]